MLLALIVIFSIGAISANDVNITDSLTTSPDENQDVLSISDDAVVESENTNTLSTNLENNSVMEDYPVTYSTILTQTTDTVYYGGSYQVTLKDSDNTTVLVNKTVNFVINGVSYTGVSDENGVASVNLALNPGKYETSAYFIGDDDYPASQNLSSAINILGTIQSKDITKYYKAGTKYTATFYTTTGNVLANTNVKITVNGKTYTVKTNGKGVASLAIDLKPGSYKVVATDPITGYKLTTTFKILSTISANDMKKVSTDSKKFQAKFLKSNGKALANKKVTFKLNGKTYKVKTDSNGIAKLSLKNLNKGTYKITSVNKDGLSQTNEIKVYKKVSTSLTSDYYTFQKSESKTIKVKLQDSLGNTPKGKTISFKVNGKYYYDKTDKKGVASIKLPSLKKGVYTVKYSFDGDSSYKASSSKNRVAIITTKTPTLTVKSTTTFGHGAGTPLKVAVTAGGVALEKRTVTFNVNNQTYTKTTDKNGIASLPINLDIGSYTVEYTVAKDSKIDSKSGSTAITVKERTPTSITWKSGTTFSEGSQVFKVLLVDSNNKAISGQTVKLTINSNTYTATTDSKGYATFKFSFSLGVYPVEVKYGGSNDYLSSSTTQSINVNVKSVKGINEANTITDLTPYLKSSENCQVDNSKIKTLVNTLTKGLTTETQKANAIFNYVRDSISYSFYYNTKYGAVGTLNAKKGNCVDHSHLLVAMFRSAGLAARYVHGKCTFSSGNTYGHVWAQVLIGNTWVIADATSSRNSLGNVANWNTNSYTFNARYASLPF